MLRNPLISYTKRRILLCTIVLLAYVSGTQESIANAKQVVFVRNTALQQVSTARFPKNAVLSASASAFFPQSQIKEMTIGTAMIQYSPTPLPTTRPTGWGTAKQIDAHTWTMNVGEDATMATARDIFAALNIYRQKHGREVLSWSDALAGYAQSRTDYFFSIQNLDGHRGFKEYLDNQDGFHKLGFAGLGENSSYGFKLEGTHLIEWVYAGDSQHNDNQLNKDWAFVGIGVSGTATNLIFGGKKL